MKLVLRVAEPVDRQRRAGDVISTGTPAGVGHGARPPRYLQPGDVVEMGITGLGTQRHKIVESR